MIKLLKLSVTAFAALLAGCATYESRPVHHTSVTGHVHGPITYYSAPPTYYAVSPAPVYVSPPVYVAPPMYVTPAPSFSMHIQSGSSFRRHPYQHGGRQRLRGGNAAGAQIGGPGWSGTVWNR
jgi:hypothetical protein